MAFINASFLPFSAGLNRFRPCGRRSSLLTLFEIQPSMNADYYAALATNSITIQAAPDYSPMMPITRHRALQFSRSIANLRLRNCLFALKVTKQNIARFNCLSINSIRIALFAALALIVRLPAWQLDGNCANAVTYGISFIINAFAFFCLLE